MKRLIASLLFFSTFAAAAAVTVTPGSWYLYQGSKIVQPKTPYATEAACVAAGSKLKGKTFCRYSTAIVSLPDAPAVTTQPVALTVEAGAAATFTVAYTGTAPITAQWSHDGVAISGATGATYTIVSAAASDAGSYSVTLGNSVGSVTSIATVLTVALPPKPADESREVICVAPTVGDWDQVRSYAPIATAPYWEAGPWLPATTPDGACVTLPPETTPTPPPDMSHGTHVYVDVSKIPATPAVGISTFNVAATTELAPGSDAGSFRTSCTLARMAFDDPIVFPGQPDASHLHTVVGNVGFNAFSTPESLRTTGNSTCRGGIANRSAYWVPTMIDTKDGTPLPPKDFGVYYKNGKIASELIQPIPEGLRMIAGDPTAKAPHPAVFSERFKCIGGPNSQNGLYGPSIGNCDVGAHLISEVFFPQCWDGKNLDSPDHKSHMSYTVNVPNPAHPGWYMAACPSTHPVALPQITFNVGYNVTEKDAPLRWRLASDNYDTTLPGGYSSHGDWFNGWKSDISDAWAKSCVQAKKDCHSHLLGDGRKIF